MSSVRLATGSLLGGTVLQEQALLGSRQRLVAWRDFSWPLRDSRTSVRSS